MTKSSKQDKKVYQSANEVFARFIPGYAQETCMEQSFDGISDLSSASGVAVGRMIVKEFTETTRRGAQQIAAADRPPATRAAGG